MYVFSSYFYIILVAVFFGRFNCFGDFITPSADLIYIFVDAFKVLAGLFEKSI